MTDKHTIRQQRNRFWQKQERFKGRFGIDLWAGNAGTSDMGWGFSTLGFWAMGSPPMYNPYYVHGVLAMNHVRTARYTPAQAAVATNDSQLVSDPVFRHDLFLGIPSENLSAAGYDEFLARGIPALSGPAGSAEISLDSADRNRDLNSFSGSESWPRFSETEWTGWRHSDIREIAFSHIFNAFSNLVGRIGGAP